MGKLDSSWWNTFKVDTEEEVAQIIYDLLDDRKFHDSYTFIGVGQYDFNKTVKFTKEDKKNAIYEFLIELIENKDSAIQ